LLKLGWSYKKNKIECITLQEGSAHPPEELIPRDRFRDAMFGGAEAEETPA